MRRFLILILASLIVGWMVHGLTSHPVPIPLVPTSGIQKAEISEQIGDLVRRNQLPSELELKVGGHFKKVRLEYSIAAHLQNQSEKLLRQYKPDYAALVAVDPATGRVLTMTSFQKDEQDAENLALKASFPAASIFKVVTAAAAIDRRRLQPDQLIAFNGGNHTLYKRNVLRNDETRWTRYITVREAFAKSVNTVFAKIGFALSPGDLAEYAERFSFNRAIATDFPIEKGFAEFPETVNFEVAEIASGFNRQNRMSPVQGALIAASVANNGVMKTPYLVDRIVDETGSVVYEAKPEDAGITVSPDSARQLRELMAATISMGTARKSFRPLLRDRRFMDAEFGGKTGSILGDNPRGKCDWFVGYAALGGKSIAIAVLTVNKEKWTVKAAYLAQALFQSYLAPQNLSQNDIHNSSPVVFK